MKTRYALDSERNSRLEALVESAKQIMRRQYDRSRFPDLDFEAARWDLNDRAITPGVRRSFCLFITRDALRSGVPADEADTLPQAFADVVKAYIIHKDANAHRAANIVTAVRHFWAGIAASNEGRKFAWDELGDEHLNRARELLPEKLGQASSRAYQRLWNQLIVWLQAQGALSYDFEWAPQPHTSPSTHATIRHRRSDRLPRRDVLEALGLIYRVHAREPLDRLLICAIGILLVAGLRFSELLSLPHDCLVSEAGPNGRIRYGIKFWNRKTRNGEFKHAIRWLSPLGAELAKECLAEILTITAPLRKRASRLERDPDRVKIDWGHRRKLVKHAEVAKVLGLKWGSLTYAVSSGYAQIRFKEPPARSGPNSKREFFRTDVEQELLRRRGALATFRISGTRTQSLSEALLLTDSYKGAVSPILVWALPASAVVGFLSGNSNQYSAFRKFGLEEKEASGARVEPLRMRTHAARHWINTVANRAGMTVFQITQWMQRFGEGQTVLYLHPSDEIADLSRELIRQKRIVGIPATVYNELPEDKRERHLGTIEHGHLVDLGICGRNFLRQGCERVKLCETECPSFMSIVGDARVISQLEERRVSYETALSVIDEMTRAGAKIVGRQHELYESVNANVEKLLKVARVKNKDA